ncbi:complex I subunit 4 family protein [Chengkuizengella axinellae]|uniref:NADH-quinone oxidoreductase subunit M n=1 Tax=Chengkuizengella axinellae TaxID=3064388 RepID=A0ABT9J7A0_9BACL|nr:NADH-quinone oxidoreductase subunit M [Chengkuizengella sp. 2205SS18-9]MDP5276839.1 NADH-quinone oxidoreductase subunit M [Chengkuizengella sp. 2205SS18-9]
MLEHLPILSLITFSPLIGILILLFIPGQKGKAIRWVAIATTILTLLFSAWLYIGFDNSSSGMQFNEEVKFLEIPLNSELIAPPGTASIDYAYEFKYIMGVDGLSLALVFLTAFVSLMAALASVYIKKRWKTFYILFLLLEIGILGVFFARDLILFFIFFEITLIPMFFLIGIWGFNDRERAANKFIIYNGVGSAIMLIAILILINTAGFYYVEGSELVGDILRYTSDTSVITDNLFDPQSIVNLEGTIFHLNDVMKSFIFIMLLIAFGIKLPIFPFHTWMLKVHIEAPPSIVMIHSGLLLKMGAYGLIRFGVILFPEQAKEWAFVLAILGIINILYGAILAFVQNEFRLILAYSSISHMGIVLLGIAAFNEAGMQGAIYQLVSHGLISALMFLIVGSIYERTQTTQLDELGGLAKSIPFISGILLIAGMASLGLPGLSGFISEFLAFVGLFETMPVVTVVGTLGIVLTAVYVLRGVLKITFGSLPVQYTKMNEARLIEAVPMIALVTFILLLGIYPAVLIDPMQETILSIITKMGG